jgi:hypothetical protein
MTGTGFLAELPVRWPEPFQLNELQRPENGLQRLTRCSPRVLALRGVAGTENA